MIETEKAWLASAIDGEESIVLEKHRIPRVYIMVCNTNKNYVKEAARLFGRKCLAVKKNSELSKIAGTDYLPVYRAYLAHHHNVQSILEEILPYLIIKRNKAAKAISFIKSRTWWHERRIGTHFTESQKQNVSEGLKRSWRNGEHRIAYERNLSNGREERRRLRISEALRNRRVVKDNRVHPNVNVRFPC